MGLDTMKIILATVVGSSGVLVDEKPRENKIASEVQVVDVQILIEDYLTSRDAFLSAGGKDFFEKRNLLRSAYLQTDISKEVIQDFVDEISNRSIRDELAHRFQEWDTKIAKGILQKEKPTLAKEKFLIRLWNIEQEFGATIDSAEFKQSVAAKSKLRKHVLGLLKKTTPQKVITSLKITDPELKNRIKHEWSWKAKE